MKSCSDLETQQVLRLNEYFLAIDMIRKVGRNARQGNGRRWSKLLNPTNGDGGALAFPPLSSLEGSSQRICTWWVSRENRFVELYQNGAHVQLSLAQALIPVKLATSVFAYLSLHESRILRPTLEEGPGSNFLGTNLDWFKANWILELDYKSLSWTIPWSLAPFLVLQIRSSPFSTVFGFKPKNKCNVGLASICHFLVSDPHLKALGPI
jgi:hypothetical protein